MGKKYYMKGKQPKPYRWQKRIAIAVVLYTLIGFFVVPAIIKWQMVKQLTAMTHRQAATAHREDHQVRQEERDMARQNGGHLTKPEQRVLNQQENGIGRQIPPK